MLKLNILTYKMRILAIKHQNPSKGLTSTCASEKNKEMHKKVTKRYVSHFAQKRLLN